MSVVAVTLYTRREVHFIDTVAVSNRTSAMLHASALQLLAEVVMTTSLMAFHILIVQNIVIKTINLFFCAW